jgi:cell division protein FtsI (penicillin-binding protein 3)
MLRNVVEQGTGKSAEVKGYGVLGKTGSADKPNNGSYDENALTTSFIGGFPAASPRYVTFVMFDEPAAIEGSFGYATAGWNAAPTTRDIVKRIAPILGVLPKNEQVKEAIINRLPAKLLAAETQGGSYAP